MKTFKSLSIPERTKINQFHSINYDMNILDAACKQLMSNPDPDFICCLSSKFSSFIESEVLPLVERHCTDMSTTRMSNFAVDSIIKTVTDNETENPENPNDNLENN